MWWGCCHFACQVYAELTSSKDYREVCFQHCWPSERILVNVDKLINFTHKKTARPNTASSHLPCLYVCLLLIPNNFLLTTSHH